MTIFPPGSGLKYSVKPTLAIIRPLLFVIALVAGNQASAREIVSLDHDWAFFQGDASGVEKPGFDSSAWRKLDVPHDWSIEGKFDEHAATTGAGGWLPSGVAWYRKEFDLPANSKNPRVWVEFDGVMANSDVWINGHHLGHRVAPGCVVRGLLVARRIVGRAIDLDEHEAVGIVRLLYHIEPCNARLLHTAARILDGGGLERLDKLRFHMDKNMDDEHWVLLLVGVGTGDR